MRRLDVTRWPAVLVFLAAGGLAVFSAYAAMNLFAEAVANLRFLGRFGYEAVRVGALWQVVTLTLWSLLALAGFMGFKICETELMQRYRAWTRPPNRRADQGKDGTGR